MFDRLITFLISIIELFYFATVLDEFEGGVMLRLGKWHRDLVPGIHWRIPFGIEQPLKINTALDSMDLPPQTFDTADGVSVSVSGYVLYRVRNPRKVLLDVEDISTVMSDSARGPIRHTLEPLTYAALRTGGKQLMEQVTKAVHAQATRWGISVASVGLSDCTRSITYRVLLDGNLTGDLGPERTE